MSRCNEPGCDCEAIKEEPKMKEWPCEHIQKAYDNKLWVFGGLHCGSDGQVGKWNLCPLCGAKRPEPKEETLEKVFRKTRNNLIELGYDIEREPEELIIALSKAIREHLKSKEGEMVRTIDGTFGNNVFSRQVAKQILRVLGVE